MLVPILLNEDENNREDDQLEGDSVNSEVGIKLVAPTALIVKEGGEYIKIL